MLVTNAPVVKMPCAESTSKSNTCVVSTSTSESPMPVPISTVSVPVKTVTGYIVCRDCPSKLPALYTSNNMSLHNLKLRYSCHTCKSEAVELSSNTCIRYDCPDSGKKVQIDAIYLCRGCRRNGYVVSSIDIKKETIRKEDAVKKEDGAKNEETNKDDVVKDGAKKDEVKDGVKKDDTTKKDDAVKKEDVVYVQYECNHSWTLPCFLEHVQKAIEKKEFKRSYPNAAFLMPCPQCNSLCKDESTIHLYRFLGKTLWNEYQDITSTLSAKENGVIRTCCKCKEAVVVGHDFLCSWKCPPCNTVNESSKFEFYFQCQKCDKTTHVFELKTQDPLTFVCMHCNNRTYVKIGRDPHPPPMHYAVRKLTYSTEYYS